LKACGVEPVLRMLIAGESLLNDGTAIVCFLIFHRMVQGETWDLWSLTLFSSRMALFAPLLGGVLAICAVLWIHTVTDEHNPSHHTIQVVITLSCAYLLFFFAENSFGTSGVLCIVFGGCVIAAFARVKIISHIEMEHVWHMFEHIATCLIFLIGGMIFGHIAFTREDIHYYDFLWIMATYFAILLSRLVVLIACYPVLSRVGYGCDFRSLLVMWWGGLRGSVGVAMAIVVDLDPNVSEKNGSEIMFLAGGAALLTLLINATTMTNLLQALGFQDQEEVKQAINEGLEWKLQAHADNVYSEMLNDARYEGANNRDVRRLIANIYEDEDTHHDASSVSDAGAPAELGGRSSVSRVHRVKKVDRHKADAVTSMRKLREVWLSVVESVYWEMVHEGTIDRRGRLARLLLQSCDAARHNISVNLSDWSALKRILHSRTVNTISHLEHYMSFITSTQQQRRRYDGKVMERNIGAALTFQHAHAVARERVANYLGVSASYQSHAVDESGSIYLSLPHPFQDDSAVVFSGRSSILMLQTTYYVKTDPHNSTMFTLYTKTGRLVTFTSEQDIEFGTFDVSTDGDNVEAQLAEHFLTVRDESDDQVAEAEKFLSGVDHDLKVQCQNRRLAKLILHKQTELAESLVDQGIIGWDDKELVMHKIRADAAQLVEENCAQKPRG